MGLVAQFIPIDGGGSILSGWAGSNGRTGASDDMVGDYAPGSRAKEIHCPLVDNPLGF